MENLNSRHLPSPTSTALLKIGQHIVQTPTPIDISYKKFKSIAAGIEQKIWKTVNARIQRLINTELPPIGGAL